MSDLELTLGTDIVAVDPGPNDALLVSHQPNPDASVLGGDDNRATLQVPTDHTEVNLGAPIGVHGETVQFDRGITGRTDHHVQLQARGLPPPYEGAARASTFLRMGVPPSTIFAPAPQPLGEPSEAPFALLPTVFLEAHSKWNGYAMLTGGAATHESTHNHTIISQKDDVRIAAKNSVLVGSPCDVFLTADQNSTVAAMVRSVDTEDSPDQPGAGNVDQTVNSVIDTTLSALDLVMGEVLLLQQFGSAFKRSPLAGQWGWDRASKADIVVNVLTQALTAVQAGLLALKSSPGGRIGLYGSGDVQIVGREGAGLHSVGHTAVSSSGATTVSGVVYAGLSASALCAVSGTITSVTGSKSVSIEAQLDDLTLRSRTNTEITSSTGTVYATAHKDAQLNSINGSVFVHGKESAYFGAGAPASRDLTVLEPLTAVANQTYLGYGVKATDHDLVIGHMNRTTNFAFPEPDYHAEGTIFMDAGVIRLKFSDSTKLEVSEDEVHMEVSGVAVTVNNQRVQLG
jgi:uncharacterized protein (DUF2345 family)